MITITERDSLLLPNSRTARFVGAENHAEISLFWVNAAPGTGPDFHWHPYSETWVILGGEARVETSEDHLLAQPGQIVTVPTETVHRFRCHGDQYLQMLCIHASPTIIQEFVS